jgi:hypothetical protein
MEAELSSRTRSVRSVSFAAFAFPSPSREADPSSTARLSPSAPDCGLAPSSTVSSFEVSAFSVAGASGSVGCAEGSSALFASSTFAGVGSAVCKGQADVSSEVEVGSLVTVVSFSGTGGGAGASVGGGRGIGSSPSSGSGTSFVGIVSCVFAVSASFETEVDLSPEASGAALSVAWVASGVGCLLAITSVD